MRLPPRPTVYEINTAVWLERLGGQSFDRGGDELSADGLYVAIGLWDSNLLAFTA